LSGDVSILGEGIGVEHGSASDGAGDFASVCRHASEDLGAVVIGDEVDRVPVGREARLGSVAVEGLSKDAGLAAGGLRDGDVMRGVLEKMGVELGDVGDELAVG